MFKEFKVTNYNYNLLRATACFLVVAHHLIPVSQTYFRLATSTCVPLFLILSGLLILNKQDEIIIFYKKRLSRLLIPFIFWVLFYSLYRIVSISINTGSGYVLVIKNIFGMGGWPFYHLWYLYLITILYIITPMLQKLFLDKSVYQKIFLQLFIVVFIQIIAINIQSSLLQNVVYYFIGGLMYNLFNYFKNSKIIILLISLLTFILGEIEVFQLVLPLIFLILLISIPTKITLFKDIAKHSFGIYLIHPFIIICYDKIVFSNETSVFIIVKLLVVFVVSYLISALLSKINFIKKIV